MKKLNNKGMTLIEIIVAVSLTSIVMVFLLNVFISVKNQTNRSNSKSSLLINQAMFIKDIEKDFNTYKLTGIDECGADINNFQIMPSNKLNDHCLKFIYNNNITGYLFYYVNNAKNIIGYRRQVNGAVAYQLVRETEVKPIANKIGTVNSINKGVQIILPIKGNDGSDYSIILNYISNDNLTINISEF